HIGNWVVEAPVDGFSIKTTIDIKLQDIVENELNSVLETVDAEWGVAVLMEVATGDIKAISNLEKSKTTGQYIEGMNRAVLGFEPGSVVKPISMLLALEDGLVSNLNQSIPIGNSYAYAGGRAITDSHYNASLTVKGVIEESSNIGMTRIITNSAGPYHNNPAHFHERLAEIGFLEPMHTGIAGERVPNIPATKSRISLSRMCYGYATEIPPLYTLSIYNAIANGGRYVRPRLVKELIGEDFDSVLPVTYIRDRICSEKNAEKLREMLTAVVWGDRGTARAWVRDENVAIAGKTGTCYMIENGHYNTSKKRLAFCGFFPAEDPQYSCIVLTCHPKQQWVGAASTSGQVMKNIARKMFSRGMLGNSSDYREIAEEGTQPVFYATSKESSRRHLTKGLEIASAKEIASGVQAKTVEGTVPPVVGLGLREAVVKIEEAGFNVSFTGNGYVRSQSPGAGFKLKEGQSVKLSLTEF
ncbi:MAG: PASTA domain-containing protein, partial [Muribaculaceae bacterium]|nr:PASTA domain-containing protein [Muribaculaceae bacterium]